MVNTRPVDLSAFKHLYPYKPNFLDRGGLKYHFVDQGQGDPVLMLHGNPTWSFYYRALIDRLSPHNRVIVPDHIGCGLSDKPGDREYGFRLQDRVADVEALLDHLGLTENLTLVVHDWGGAVGLAVAVNNPGRVARLVITNTAGFYPPPEKGIPWQLRLVRNFRFIAETAVLAFNLFARGAAFLATKKGLSREARAGLLAPYNSKHNRLATLRFVQDIPLKPGDPSFELVKRVQDSLHLLADKPMLICWGMGDFVFDRWYWGEWRRRFPAAEAKAFPQAGHYLLEDEPQAVSDLIADFLKRHPLGQGAEA